MSRPVGGPVTVRADELLVTAGEQGKTMREVPMVFDTEGQQVMVLLDHRPAGGPIECYGLNTTTAYAVAMAILQMRRRILRGQAQASPSTRSEDRP